METEEKKEEKSWLEVFKYNAVLSALFFIASTVVLSTQVTGYSFTKYTISDLSYFLNHNQLSFFSFLFIIKCLLDLSFILFVFKKYQHNLNFVTSAVWLVAVLSFGLIGFFPVSQYPMIHYILAGCLFLFWTIGEHVFGRIIRTKEFLDFTNKVIFVQIAAVLFLFSLRQFNAIFELVYFALALFWLTIFINRYL